MFTLNDISVYIFNWKKVTSNSLKLYHEVSPIVMDTTIINCDENYKLDNKIPHVQLNDSYYYGAQYDTAIKNVKENKIFCVIVGDNLSNNNFEKIFSSAVNTFNKYQVGVYAPNDKRSHHKKRNQHFQDDLYHVDNTDCGFWFIHPTLVKRLKNINYTVSKYGWGIDVITIEESRKHGLLVLRDYSIETDQLDHSCGYDTYKATKEVVIMKNEYLKSFKYDTPSNNHQNSIRKQNSNINKSNITNRNVKQTNIQSQTSNNELLKTPKRNLNNVKSNRRM